MIHIALTNLHAKNDLITVKIIFLSCYRMFHVSSPEVFFTDNRSECFIENKNKIRTF